MHSNEPKWAANGYIEFSKLEFSKLAKDNPDKNLKEINMMLAEKWKSISDDEKLKYKELGTSEFQQKSSQWEKVQEEARIAKNYPLPHPSRNTQTNETEQIT